MRLHMTIWLYRSVYLERKHERDVWDVWDEVWSSWGRALGKRHSRTPWLSPIGLVKPYRPNIPSASQALHRGPLNPTTCLPHPQVLVPWALESNKLLVRNSLFQRPEFQFEIPPFQLIIHSLSFDVNPGHIFGPSEVPFSSIVNSHHQPVHIIPYKISVQNVISSINSSSKFLRSSWSSIAWASALHTIAFISQFIKYPVQKPESSPKFASPQLSSFIAKAS